MPKVLIVENALSVNVFCFFVEGEHGGALNFVLLFSLFEKVKTRMHLFRIKESTFRFNLRKNAGIIDVNFFLIAFLKLSLNCIFAVLLLLSLID